MLIRVRGNIYIYIYIYLSGRPPHWEMFVCVHVSLVPTGGSVIILLFPVKCPPIPLGGFRLQMLGCLWTKFIHNELPRACNPCKNACRMSGLGPATRVKMHTY